MSREKAEPLAQLRGTDRRSIGTANIIAQQAIADPSLITDLFAGLSARDPVVQMRCADALEKATRLHPQHLQPFVRKFLPMIHPDQPQELLWHLLQMCPRIRWTKPQAAKLFTAIQSCLTHKSSIVKTSALQAAADVAASHPQFQKPTSQLLNSLAMTGTRAMQARARKLLSTSKF